AQSLPEVARQIATNALLRLTVDVAPAADEELSKLQREAMFFIAANAMGNVARHARASALAVTLRAAADGVVLEIADDGVGFATERSVDGFGLRNMRQRAFEVGGRVDVESAPGEGTRVRFAIRSGGRNGHDG
ncbi:MAG: sensor histidine kinase, partial [Deltaproteobacteria bacterium]|nr:sensor histidine kinase [Deltaproteobacteria bacterium]